MLLPNTSTVNEVLHSASSPVDLVLVASSSPLSWPQSIIVSEPDGKFAVFAYQILLIITPCVLYRTYRVLGFIVLACDIIAVILVKDRIKRPLFQKKKLSDILKFDVFKHPPYRIWALAATIQLMPYFVPFYYLPCKLLNIVLSFVANPWMCFVAYATWLGLSDKQGSALVAVTSAMNFVGRIICG